MTDLGSFMDARTKMIIANGKPISSDVVCCHFDGCAKKMGHYIQKWKNLPLLQMESYSFEGVEEFKPEELPSEVQGKISFEHHSHQFFS